MNHPLSLLPSECKRAEFIDNDHYVTSIGYNLAIASLSNPSEFEFLEGHSQVISSFTVSKSRKIAASGQCGKESTTEKSTPVIVWDLATREQILVLRGHVGAIKCMTISDDDRILAVSTDNSSKIWIWDLQEQDLGTFLDLHETPSTIVFAGSVTNEWYLHVTYSKYLAEYRIKFDHRTFEFTETHASYTNPTNGYFRTYTASCGSYPYFFAGSVSGEVSIYNGMSNTMRTFVEIDQYEISALATVSADEVLVGGKRLTLIKGNDKSWSIVKSAEIESPVAFISYLNGKALVRTEDTCLWIADVPSLRVRKIFDGIRGPAYDVACNNNFAAIALRDYGFALIRIGKPLELVAYLPKVKTHSVAAMPNGQFIAGLEDGSLNCINDTGSIAWKSDRVHRGPVTAICVTKEFIATGGEDGFIRLMTHQSHAIVNESLVHNGTVLQIIPAINYPQRVHSVSTDRTITTTEITTGKRICQQIINGRIGFETIQQFTDGELEILAGMGDGSLRAYDWPRKGVIFEEHTPDGLQINSIALKPKSRVVACAGQSEYISIIDFATGAWSVCGAGHTMITHKLAWTPDGKTLLSAADDGVAMWRF